MSKSVCESARCDVCVADRVQYCDDCLQRAYDHRLQIAGALQ